MNVCVAIAYRCDPLGAEAVRYGPAPCIQNRDWPGSWQQLHLWERYAEAAGIFAHRTAHRGRDHSVDCGDPIRTCCGPGWQPTSHPLPASIRSITSLRLRTTGFPDGRVFAVQLQDLGAPSRARRRRPRVLLDDNLANAVPGSRGTQRLPVPGHRTRLWEPGEQCVCGRRNSANSKQYRGPRFLLVTDGTLRSQVTAGALPPTRSRLVWPTRSHSRKSLARTWGGY